MLVVEADLQIKLHSEAPRGMIFSNIHWKSMESNLNHRSSNHGKPVSYNTTPADRTIRSEDTYEKGMIQYANNLI